MCGVWCVVCVCVCAVGWPNQLAPVECVIDVNSISVLQGARHAHKAVVVVHVCVCTSCTCVCVHTCTYTCAHTHMHMHTLVYTRIHIHVRTHLHAHTCTCTYVYMHAYTLMYTHTHTNMHIQITHILNMGAHTQANMHLWWSSKLFSSPLGKIKYVHRACTSCTTPEFGMHETILTPVHQKVKPLQTLSQVGDHILLLVATSWHRDLS